MNAGILRLIACVLMLADHIGAIFVPDEPLWRLVGRGAFPLFAFLIAEGCRHTRNPEAYVHRLLLAAAVAQLPFALAFPHGDAHSNVLFTLSLAACALFAFPRFGFPGVAFVAVLSELVRADYGAGGVLAVFIFWRMGSATTWRLRLGFIIAAMLLALRQASDSWFLGKGFAGALLLEGFAVLAIFAGEAYDRSPGWQGKASRWLFYSFYPAHLAVLALVHVALRSSAP